MNFIQQLPSPIGTLTIEADDHHLLRIDLHTREVLERPNAITQTTVELLKAYFRSEIPDFSTLPFCWPKAPFYARVLQTLLKSDYGTRLSYGELAALAGRAKAHRAAAAAVARNPFAVAIPCHRIVHASGGVGAYGWGPAKKAWLLHHETIDLQMDQ